MKPLSPREMEVARLVADDLTDKEISQILRISIRTVQGYLDRIGKKLSTGQSPYTRRRAIARHVEALETPKVEAA
jgi:DNA-binding CsgD family transcriptional regulator